MTERLDKLIASQGKLSRSDVKKMVKSGRVTVDGVAVKSADIKVDADASVIAVDGKALNYKCHIVYPLFRTFLLYRVNNSNPKYHKPL